MFPDPWARIVLREGGGRTPCAAVPASRARRAPRRWVVALVALALAGCSEAVSGKHLFVLAGQSNMAHLDPAVSFVPTIAAALGPNRVIVVKDAIASLPIQAWDRDWQLPETEVEARRLSPTIHALRVRELD